MPDPERDQGLAGVPASRTPIPNISGHSLFPEEDTKPPVELTLGGSTPGNFEQPETPDVPHHSGSEGSQASNSSQTLSDNNGTSLEDSSRSSDREDASSNSDILIEEHRRLRRLRKKHNCSQDQTKRRHT